ncbi:hypothetical protein [Corynebacterium caspium]|uniref:hypothetical protein n=1 Tax=Corynebacterium caspium TaxID=234828 RepID=UPI00037C4D94|nr:hypothetical protein [Corynebacterium caspium]WKD59659.1 hypothetical protein CCASP_06380 [Corynebacterium caspium DSM 44850]
MALHLSIDLKNATLADLENLVAAAHSAQASSDTKLELDPEKQTLTLHAEGKKSPVSHTEYSGEQRWNIPNSLGENAVRSVIDILTGRLEPPHSSDRN